MTVQRPGEGGFYQSLMGDLAQFEKSAAAPITEQGLRNVISPTELEALAAELQLDLSKEAEANVGFDRAKGTVEEINDRTARGKEQRLEGKTKGTENKVRQAGKSDGGVGSGSVEGVDDTGTLRRKEERLEGRTRAGENKVRQAGKSDGGVGSGSVEGVDDTDTLRRKEQRLEAQSRSNAEKAAGAVGRLRDLLKEGAAAESLIDGAVKEAAFGFGGAGANLAAIAQRILRYFPSLGNTKASAVAQRVVEKAQSVATRLGKGVQETALAIVEALKKKVSGGGAGMPRAAAEDPVYAEAKQLVKQAILSGKFDG